MQKLVTSHACALGVPEEYIFFPLLSCVAGAMGRAEVKVNEEWKEKCAIWCAVVGRQGSRRTATLNRFISAAYSHGKKIAIPEEKFPDILNSVKDDVHMNTLIHEDLAMVFDLLLKDSKINLSRIKRLYDTNSIRSGPPTLNMAGFVAHEEAQSFFTQQCGEITSRMLVTFPSNVVYFNKDLRVPMPSNTPSLSELFEVLWLRHSEPQIYSLCGPAKTIFSQYYDSYISALREMEPGDKWYSHVAKAPAQVARLSSLLCALRQALKCVVYREDASLAHWYWEVGQEDVEASKIIVDQALRTKFALMDITLKNGLEPPRSEPPSTPNSAPPSEPPPPKRPRVPSPKIETQINTVGNGTNGGGQRDAVSSQTSQSLSSNYQNHYQPTSYAVSQQLNSLLRAAAMHRTQLAGDQMTSPQQSQLSYHQQLESATRQEYNNNLINAQQVDVVSASNHWGIPSPTNSTPSNNTHHSNTNNNGALHHNDIQLHHTQNNNSGDPLVSLSQPRPLSRNSAPHTPAGQSHSSTCSQESVDIKDEGVRAFFYRNSMDQPLGLFDEDPKKFIEENGVKLKKLLEFRMDYRISPSTCAQRHLIPPLSRKEMLKYDTQTKYPVQVAKEFLLKVAQLGFGSIETVIHPANKRRSSFFQKLPYDQLTEEAKLILEKLNVSEQDYMSAFLPNGGRDAMYGFPFTPEMKTSLQNLVGGVNVPHYAFPSPDGHTLNDNHHNLNDSHATLQDNHSNLSDTHLDSHHNIHNSHSELISQHMLLTNPKTEPLDMHDSDESQL